MKKDKWCEREVDE